MINQKPFETLEDVRRNDSTIAQAIHEPLTMEQIIVLLANQKRDLVNELIRLESLCPRAYRLPDGRVMVWHCPDELVPIRNLGQ